MRIPTLERSQVDAATSAVYDHIFHLRGRVPNMFKTAAHRPEMLKTMFDHYMGVMKTGSVPLKLKELLIVRVSQLNACEY